MNTPNTTAAAAVAARARKDKPKFRLYGKPPEGEAEEIDTAPDRREANRLLGEYRMAYTGWSVWKVNYKRTNAEIDKDVFDYLVALGYSQDEAETLIKQRRDEGARYFAMTNPDAASDIKLAMEATR